MDVELSQQLQAIEQQLQQLTVHKQSVHTKTLETDSALRAVGQTTAAYKAIGNLLVLKNPDELKKELQEEKEHLSARMQAFEKQEQKLQDKRKEIQAKLMEQMGGKNE